MTALAENAWTVLLKNASYDIYLIHGTVKTAFAEGKGDPSSVRFIGKCTFRQVGNYNPNGNVTAPKGSTWISTTNGTYMNTDGSTTWELIDML